MHLTRSIWLLVSLSFFGNVAIAKEFRLMVFGDSLSSAYNLEPGEGWVDWLKKSAAEKGKKLVVINESIPGETTAGGLARLPAVLERVQPDAVLVALGANDGLRGLPMPQMKQNLLEMFATIAAQGHVAVHIGIELPRNYGAAYLSAFRNAQDEVADQTKLPYLPFLLAPIALDESLFQADGHHPTAEAQLPIAAYVSKWLAEVLPKAIRDAQ